MADHPESVAGEKWMMVDQAGGPQAGGYAKERVEDPEPQACPGGRPSVIRLAEFGDEPTGAGARGARDSLYQGSGVGRVETVEKKVRDDQVVCGCGQRDGAGVGVMVVSRRRRRGRGLKPACGC